MRNILLALGALFLVSTASAGDWAIEAESADMIEVEYTGDVDFSDPKKWLDLVEYADGRIIRLVINSGGGYAFAGTELFWLMDAYPRLVTVGGADYGAWSAAAIMWCAGDVRLVEAGGGVWFHAAYCWWDPNPAPDIGCDTTAFQIELMQCLEQAGFNGYMFNFWLNEIQLVNGTDGWIGITNGGWYTYDSTDGWMKPFDSYLIGWAA